MSVTREQAIERIQHFYEVERAGKPFTTLDVLFDAWGLTAAQVTRVDFIDATGDCRTLGYVDAVTEIAGHIVRAWRRYDDLDLAQQFADRLFGDESMPEPLDLAASMPDLERRTNHWLSTRSSDPFTLGDLLIGVGFDRHALGYRHAELGARLVEARGYETHYDKIGGCWMSLHSRRRLN